MSKSKFTRDPNKPMIAKDTKEPLVVMGGYHLGEGGGIIRQTVPPGDNRPQASDSDKALLAKYGLKKLEEFGYAGVIDRLKTSGLI